MSAIKISAWLGVVLSVIGIFLKIARVLRQSEPLPFIAYDYLAAVLRPFLNNLTWRYALIGKI